MKVAVIVDDLDADRRRRCFWEEQLDLIPGIEYELVSLLEKMDDRKFFNVYEYDVIIFNWCVLDGALMYASDRVQDIVAFYDDHFVQFVMKGGILIMENQPKRWRPSQMAYDVLLQGQVKVSSRDKHLFGSKVLVNDRLRKHPLFRHLPDTLYSAYLHALDESWFPVGSTSIRSLQELHPTKVYSGAFVKWNSDWLPVLYTEDRSYPVMLLKTEGLGLWVVTTMYLASSNIRELVESIILGSSRHSLAIQAFHARQSTVRKLQVFRLVFLSLLVGGGVYAIQASGLVAAHIPEGDTIAGNLAVSVFFAGLASAASYILRYTRGWLRAALNR